MSAINLISGNSFGETLPDLETVRLIYTHKKKYKKGTVSIHLTVKDLHDIISEIESMTEPDKMGKGVRLYIAEYPANYPKIKKNNNADYSNCQTVVAVPTYIGMDGKTHFDFMDEKKVKECKKEIDKGTPPPPQLVSAQDHYNLCPPNTGCANGSTIWNNL